MTAQQIKSLRKNLGWSVNKFAQLLGVSASAVTRWEADNSAAGPPLETGSGQIIALLSDVWGRKNQRDQKKFSENIDKTLVIHGRLRALYEVLREAYDSDKAA